MKGTLAIIAVFATLLVIGCTAPDGTNANLKDCGSNLTCFNNAFSACEPAKVQNTDTDGDITTTLYGEVKGGTASNCTIYMKINDISVSANASDQEKLAMFIKGADMTCVGLSAENALSAFPKDEAMSKCSGTLIDLIKAGKE
ncbi:hypothetical protein H0N95_00280 [Candidatus Micrarchaeota archaeon]|nr:hypothetical protein [Candidatus Micrarchaeota archaeon]